MSLNIVFVTETYPPEVNGVAMTVGRLVQGLRAAGHHVTVVRPRQSGESPEKAGYELVRSLPIPGSPGLRRLWRQQPPDVVHVVTEGPLGWSAVNAARALKIPVTSGFHTNFDRYSVHYGLGFLRPAVAAYLRTMHRRTRATMVPTEALAAEWRLTDRRLIGPSGQAIARADLARAQRRFGDVVLVTRSGEKHLMKYLADADAVLDTLGQVTGARSA